MPRFFAEEISGGEAVFIEDAPHISQTLRLRPGDEIHALDGKGGVYLCELNEVGKKRVTATVLHAEQPQGETNIDITVYQGICRAHRFDFVAQKCTELGAKAIVPLLLHRCETREYSPSKLERFAKIAREAAKQSGRSIIPEIRPAIGVSGIAHHDLLLCPYELERERSLKQIISGNEYASIGIVIGPEGGFEPDEIDELRSRCGQTFTLGSRILRTETAAAVVIAMLLYEFSA